MWVLAYKDLFNFIAAIYEAPAGEFVPLTCQLQGDQFNGATGILWRRDGSLLDNTTAARAGIHIIKYNSRGRISRLAFTSSVAFNSSTFQCLAMFRNLEPVLAREWTVISEGKLG